MFKTHQKSEKVGCRKWKNKRKAVIAKKKFQKNSIDNHGSYKKLSEKSKKKFGRIKKVRTFALANEVRGYSLKEIARVHWNNRNLR